MKALAGIGAVVLGMPRSFSKVIVFVKSTRMITIRITNFNSTGPLFNLNIPWMREFQGLKRSVSPLGPMLLTGIIVGAL